ncbi:hypothetical protein BDV36DRAFT_277953 [Aspergillus pseudocaelatus]|uniref:Uncharacterized protein n=1 Tax=Aspergillus pseudocaelatus TaxID=1825620 RepID=A0ABQ6VZZ0_9EURO|nr:hypothetical protein BDV36DRAFT_277953 [Aspergillus pseudocaelatus]
MSSTLRVPSKRVVSNNCNEPHDRCTELGEFEVITPLTLTLIIKGRQRLCSKLSGMKTNPSEYQHQTATNLDIRPNSLSSPILYFPCSSSSLHLSLPFISQATKHIPPISIPPYHHHLFSSNIDTVSTLTRWENSPSTMVRPTLKWGKYDCDPLLVSVKLKLTLALSFSIRRRLLMWSGQQNIC